MDPRTVTSSPAEVAKWDSDWCSWCSASWDSASSQGLIQFLVDLPILNKEPTSDGMATRSFNHVGLSHQPDPLELKFIPVVASRSSLADTDL